MSTADPQGEETVLIETDGEPVDVRHSVLLACMVAGLGEAYFNSIRPEDVHIELADGRKFTAADAPQPREGDRLFQVWFLDPAGYPVTITGAPPRSQMN